MTPLLSIVVPVHAASVLEASYVDSCLRSLSGDRLPVEVIAVDDGSPVPVGSYPGVMTVRRPANRGLGAARNLGLSLVSGRYVWFVDGDDIVPPGALAGVVRWLDQLDPDVLLVGHAVTSGPDSSSAPSRLSDVVTLRSCPRLLRVRQAAWNRIVRVDLLRRTGVRFPDGLYEDVPYSHLVLVAARSIAVRPGICYIYRTRQRSLTRTAGPHHFDVFDQYERLFATLSGWRASPRLLARLHAVMVRHYLTILGAPDRVPPALRRAFFARTVLHERRYRPVSGPPASPGMLALRLGSFRAYRLAHLAKSVWRRPARGKDLLMTDPHDVVDEGVTDVLTEDEVVQVSPAAAELAQTLEHESIPTYPADVPDWDEEDPLPSA
jgi:glycosyltransferase involved in cell wall biosynthesis